MTIVYGYRHEDQQLARARYEERESNAEWFRRLEQESALKGPARRDAEASSYAHTIWRHLAIELTGTDPHHAELLIRAVYIGNPAERAQAAYDLRGAIAVHGIHGAPSYLTRMATQLVATPGQERRAAMFSAIAEALNPAHASELVRSQQRRYWTGTTSRASDLNDGTTPSLPSAHRRRRAR